MLSTIKSEVQKGFTLIELLIVIAILAILTTIVVIVLNPAELLAQGRDSQRFADLSTVRTALSFYLKDRGCSAPTWENDETPAAGELGDLRLHSTDTQATEIWHSSNLVTASTDNNVPASAVAARPVDRTGWIRIDMRTITGGSPISSYPVDPTNSALLEYQFQAARSSATTTGYTPCGFEVRALALESVQYRTTEDKDATDGGDDAASYEVGTDPGLDLL